MNDVLGEASTSSGSVFSALRCPTEAGPDRTMSSTTDSPIKTFTTLQNVVECPDPSAVAADLYAEVAATATSAAQVASKEADGDGAADDNTTGAEVPYVPMIEEFVYFDPSASIKYV